MVDSLLEALAYCDDAYAQDASSHGTPLLPVSLGVRGRRPGGRMFRPRLLAGCLAVASGHVDARECRERARRSRGARGVDLRHSFDSDPRQRADGARGSFRPPLRGDGSMDVLRAVTRGPGAGEGEQGRSLGCLRADAIAAGRGDQLVSGAAGSGSRSGALVADHASDRARSVGDSMAARRCEFIHVELRSPTRPRTHAASVPTNRRESGRSTRERAQRASCGAPGRRRRTPWCLARRPSSPPRLRARRV